MSPQFLPRLALQKMILNPLDLDLDVHAARKAAARLLPHLPRAGAGEFLVRDQLDPSQRHRLAAPVNSPLLSSPCIVFAESSFSAVELPDSWWPSYLPWPARVQRTRNLNHLLCRLAIQRGVWSPLQDSLLAGLLLHLTDEKLEHQWLQWCLDEACQTPAGAWLALASSHPNGRINPLLCNLQSDTWFLWNASLLSGLGSVTVKLALPHLDLWSALVLATNASPDVYQTWLIRLGQAGGHEPAAAAAALALLPHADEFIRYCWITTLQQTQSARFAYEAVRWSRHTWPAEKWDALKSALKPVAIADRAQWACHWYRDVEPPDQVTLTLGHPGWELLWAAELLAAVPTTDEVAFRFRLGEALGTPQEAAALLVLNWLNQRAATKS